MNLLVTTVLFFFTELSVIADGRRKKSPNFLKYQDCGTWILLFAVHFLFYLQYI